MFLLIAIFAEDHLKSAIYFNLSGKRRIFCLMCASELLDDAATDDDEYVVFAVDS